MTKNAATLGALAVLLLVLLLGALMFLGPSSVPAGQRPLAPLSPASFSDFSAAFDAASGVPRLVLLLSPT